MPEGVEHLHAVQIAVDNAGLRYQVLDDQGSVREKLAWPRSDLPHGISLKSGFQPSSWLRGTALDLVQLRLKCIAQLAGRGERQSLFAARDAQTGKMPLWIGLIGKEMQLTANLQPTAGHSRHHWLGPSLQDQQPFDIEILLHQGMGPGGILWRSPAWSSFQGISAWGLERLEWPDSCLVGAIGTCEEAISKGPELHASLSTGILE